ncbi:unnamed protein product, partial [Amoebophrya sp. A120]
GNEGASSSKSTSRAVSPRHLHELMVLAKHEVVDPQTAACSRTGTVDPAADCFASPVLCSLNLLQRHAQGLVFTVLRPPGGLRGNKPRESDAKSLLILNPWRRNSHLKKHAGGATSVDDVASSELAAYRS